MYGMEFGKESFDKEIRTVSLLRLDWCLIDFWLIKREFWKRNS